MTMREGMQELPKVAIDLPRRPALNHAYIIATGALKQNIPPYPSLYHWLKNWAPKQQEYAQHAVLGKIGMLSPSEDNAVAHFTLPEGHPSASNEAGQIMALPVSAEVVDTIVNSGALTGLDNIVLGISEGGIVVEVAIFIEVEQ
jgi:hypothetical protein